MPKSQASISDGAKSLAGAELRQGVFDNHTVVDAKRVPQNIGENMEKRLIKMSR